MEDSSLSSLSLWTSVEAEFDTIVLFFLLPNTVPNPGFIVVEFADSEVMIGVVSVSSKARFRLVAVVADVDVKFETDEEEILWFEAEGSFTRRLEATEDRREPDSDEADADDDVVEVAATVE